MIEQLCNDFALRPPRVIAVGLFRKTETFQINRNHAVFLRKRFENIFPSVSRRSIAVNQNERRSRSFFLIMNFHAADVGKFAVFGMRNCRFQFVKRNIRRTRKPENRQRDCQNRNERKQNFQKFFQHLLILTLLTCPRNTRKRRKNIRRKNLISLFIIFVPFVCFVGKIF